MNSELEMLKAFYLAWEEFHSIEPGQLHRIKAKAAAQRLVEQAHVLRNFYAPAKMSEVMLNG